MKKHNKMNINEKGECYNESYIINKIKKHICKGDC